MLFISLFKCWPFSGYTQCSTVCIKEGGRTGKSFHGEVKADMVHGIDTLVVTPSKGLCSQRAIFSSTCQSTSPPVRQDNFERSPCSLLSMMEGRMTIVLLLQQKEHITGKHDGKEREYQLSCP